MTDFESDCSKILDRMNFSDNNLDFLDSLDCNVDECVNLNIYQSKSGLIWSTEIPKVSKVCKENISDKPPGITAFVSQRIVELIDCLIIFLNDNICELIIKNTNKFGDYYKESWKELKIIDFKAYIGLLIYMAIFKSKLESLKLLWSVDKG